MAHVAFIAKNHLNPAYGGALYGARSVAARFGLEVRHSAPEKPDDIAQQAVLIEQAIDAKPAAILLIAAHETKLAPAIRAINRARIPLVSLVGEPREGEWLCHVGSDDVAEGKAGRRALLEQVREVVQHGDEARAVVARTEVQEVMLECSRRTAV